MTGQSAVGAVLALLAQTLHLLLPGDGPLLAVAALATLALLVRSTTRRALRGRLRLLMGTGAARRPWPRREYTWHTAFLPQRDPDARGRRRPRAPSALLRAVTDRGWTGILPRF
ncbi:DUF6412 domain-containing protein [Streptacidiphilus anmyonensis]|uniref:DUF6412 domain-containing protein n=1 Tax=Streptacidiphilus anmyonensis TaxID=405782 RepID=UPI0005A74BA9|nr:DUF6412 domain-containing protein [Streptacidiphilus anmyonensis]